MYKKNKNKITKEISKQELERNLSILKYRKESTEKKIQEIEKILNIN
jgi:hypothetical protein